jgi:hypothetical protein
MVPLGNDLYGERLVSKDHPIGYLGVGVDRFATWGSIVLAGTADKRQLARLDPLQFQTLHGAIRDRGLSAQTARLREPYLLAFPAPLREDSMRMLMLQQHQFRLRQPDHTRQT